MENAADALKMVLGIFMFVLGLTLFFYMTQQVRATSDVVLYESDNYKEIIQLETELLN